MPRLEGQGISCACIQVATLTKHFLFDRCRLQAPLAAVLRLAKDVQVVEHFSWQRQWAQSTALAGLLDASLQQSGSEYGCLQEEHLTQLI